MQIILKNIRSFLNPAPIPIRPLTILVGENSTGKTTFLAMLSHVCPYEFPYFRPSFSVPPFDLGSFDSIATYKGGRGGRAGSFSVGFIDQTDGEERKIVATYVNQKGQPGLQEVVASGSAGTVTVRIDVASSRAVIKISTGRDAETEPMQTEVDLRKFPRAELPFRVVLQVALLELSHQEHAREKPVFLREKYFDLVRLFRGGNKSIFALAPVRTRPRRTYEQTSDDFDPEGDNTFVFLARLWQEEDSSERLRIFHALDKFGETSMLFKRIKVKRFGKKPSDPFQILVAHGGQPTNLLDVGYGVSQALPVIVQSVLAVERGLLLLQQPEIHLHPRAQAALGSFFARLVANEKKEVVIETHSEYLLDRIRREVAQDTIPARDVLILFFDRRGIRTRIHEIHLDDDGNIIGAPKNYRQFFLEEEISLFNRAKS